VRCAPAPLPHVWIYTDEFDKLVRESYNPAMAGLSPVFTDRGRGFPDGITHGARDLGENRLPVRETDGLTAVDIGNYGRRQRMTADARIVLLALLVSASAQAQQRWTKTYGGLWGDYGRSVQLTADSGYIVTGYTENFGAGLTDFYLIKADGSGDTIWTKTYGDDGYQSAYSVRKTVDEGFVMVGPTMPPWGTVFDIWIVKTDSSGNTVWTWTWGGGGDDEGRDIQQTADGGYIVVGRTTSMGSGGNDIVLIRLTGSGDSVWIKTIGGTGHDIGYSVQQTADGGFIIAGLSTIGGRSEDVYLVKTDSMGDTIWTRTYGGTGYDVGLSIDRTTDGGYVVAGQVSSLNGTGKDVYLIRTNSSGDTLWTRTFGGNDFDVGNSVQQTSDSGYIVAGTMYFSPTDPDVYLVKTDASGDTLWTRTFGGTGVDDGSSVQQTPDGGYIVAGRTASYGAGNGDVWLIKTDVDGYVALAEPGHSGPEAPVSLNVVPNPFVSFARVPGHETERFELFDAAGKTKGIFAGNRIGEGLPPAVYFLRPVGEAGDCLRVVKVR
jgi:hypothetical protein